MAGIDLRAIRENDWRMMDDGETCRPCNALFILIPFAGPLGETVPAIFQTVSDALISEFEPLRRLVLTGAMQTDVGVAHFRQARTQACQDEIRLVAVRTQMP